MGYSAAARRSVERRVAGRESRDAPLERRREGEAKVGDGTFLDTALEYLLFNTRPATEVSTKPRSRSEAGPSLAVQGTALL